MNIFDQNDVVVQEILGAKKICQPCGYTKYDSEYRSKFSYAPHGFYSIIFTVDGESDFIFDGKTLTAKKDCVVFLDNRTPFCQTTKKDYYMYCINFTATTGFIHQPAMEMIKNREKYLSLFNEAAASYEQKKPGYILNIKSILYKILSTIKYDNMKLNHPGTKLDKVVLSMDYINTNISNPQLSVEQLAYKLNISNTYLRKIFIEVTGESPIRYIKKTRINYACNILQTENASVKDTAIKSGFQDVSYFCKEFKKIMGVSPHSFKSKHHLTVFNIHK